MTEAEWLECRSPHPMLYFLDGTVSDRKMWLFAIACCRRCPYQSTDSRSRYAIDTFGRWVEKQAGDAELQAAFADAEAAEREAWSTKRLGYPELLARALTGGVGKNAPGLVERVRKGGYALESVEEGVGQDAPSHAGGIAAWAVQLAGNAAWLHTTGNRRTQKRAMRSAWEDENQEQAKLLRDIMGNPFHPVTADPSWFTPTVVQLARIMYDDEMFEQMGELAEALERAGCGSKQMLDHCRGPGPHVRGCWVVDLVLGKA